MTVQLSTCRHYSAARSIKAVPKLTDATLQTFRDQAFKVETPALLPKGTFADIPAIHKWFRTSAAPRLNVDYLSRFGDATVSVEITKDGQFARVEQPMTFFLDATASPGQTGGSHIYLAQAPIPDLPQGLRDDVPAPELVRKAGAGDIYDSSIWLGLAPTYTPLHRDPNPNLFVQLIGTKRVRLMQPNVGRNVFARVQERVGGMAQAHVRGEEMMTGMERDVLDEEVWGSEGGGELIWEAEVEGGDGLFVPTGWWHCVKGVGKGMTGSVNWWFR